MGIYDALHQPQEEGNGESDNELLQNFTEGAISSIARGLREMALSSVGVDLLQNMTS